MRKKQGDKQKVCKRKVAQKLVKKQKRRIGKKLVQSKTVTELS